MPKLKLPLELSRGELEKIPFKVTYTITPEDKREYERLFELLEPQDGLLLETNVRKFFQHQDILPVSSLDKIWELSDQDGDGRLDGYEWTVAAHLTMKAIHFGYPIPDQVITDNLERH